MNVDPLLSACSSLSIAVVGDFCVDAYWIVGDTSERSLETELPVRKVAQQRYSLGGAGNVAANLAALGVGTIRAVGLLGDDLFGRELQSMFAQLRIDASGMTAADDWQTLVYGKPIVDGCEEPRLDFGAFNLLTESLTEQLLHQIDRAADLSQVVILNQQVIRFSETAIERMNSIVRRHPEVRFIVDARQDAHRFERCILKLNIEESRRYLEEAGVDFPKNATTPEVARMIHERTTQPVFITRGEAGMVVAANGTTAEIDGIQLIGPIDPVGAGDTAVAAIAAALAAGESPESAGRFANLCASITVQKLQVTGTATPAEIRSAAASVEYVYNASLADHPECARRVPGTDFEIIRSLPGKLAIRHAIFDHDGTLSTLREGWESIMRPMMIRAILGPRFEHASPEELARITELSRQFIDQTTGIQTLVQMQGLAKLVRDAGYVPANEILDEHGYKAIYNAELIKQVRERIAKLERDQSPPKNFQILNAFPFLQHLHSRGVKLYLASGTDEADVIHEAKVQGYAHLFEGRIYGAVGDVNVEAKKIVLENIIRENNLAGHEFVTFGDGPVEMRETHKRGGVAIGLCSDEVKRSGWNLEKRKRLIRGGADVLIPDFGQLPQLLHLLRLD